MFRFFIILSSACLISMSHGFVMPSSMSSTSTKLFSSSSAPLDDDARLILYRAEVCAFDDGCPLEDVESSLNGMLAIQSECQSGDLSGKDLCNDADHAAEIVAHLRDKLSKLSSTNLENIKNSSGPALLERQELPIYLIMFAAAMFWYMMDSASMHSISLSQLTLPQITASTTTATTTSIPNNMGEWNHKVNEYLANGPPPMYFRNGGF